MQRRSTTGKPVCTDASQSNTEPGRKSTDGGKRNAAVAAEPDGDDAVAAVPDGGDAMAAVPDDDAVAWDLGQHDAPEPDPDGDLDREKVHDPPRRREEDSGLRSDVTGHGQVSCLPEPDHGMAAQHSDQDGWNQVSHRREPDGSGSASQRSESGG